MEGRARPHPFSVAFVCTGNRARSPFAEALVRHRVEPGAVTVISRGTLDLGPVPALPEAVDAAAFLGIDLRAHRARALGKELEHVDLVLGFEPQHVAVAVIDGGSRHERTFTLPELANLLAEAGSPGALPPDDIVRHARERRHGSPLSAPAIPDPLGEAPAVFRRTFEEIDDLLSHVVSALFRGATRHAIPPA